LNLNFILVPQNKSEPLKEPVIQQVSSSPSVPKTTLSNNQQQQRQNVQIPSLPHLNTFEAIKNLSTENQKIGVVNPVVVNKQINPTKDSSSILMNSMQLDNSNVSNLPSVLNTLPKVDMSQLNADSSSQQSFENFTSNNHLTKNRFR